MLSSRLWRNGAFLRFFISASLSVVGDWFNTVAIAVLTYRITGRVSLVAVTIAVSVLPRLILAPIGGALADRFERRSFLVTLDVLRALVALLPLLAHNTETLWLVYAAVLVLQAGACLYNPALGSYLPRLVSDDQLEAANAVYTTMRDVGFCIGPALAAAVLGLWGPWIAFWSNALSFVISALLLLTLPKAALSVRTAGLRSLIVGYSAILRRYPRIAALYPCFLAYTAPIYFLQATMVAFALRLGQPANFIGVIYAIVGLSGALGGIAMGQYLRRLPYGLAIGIFALNTPLLGLFALAHQAVPALLLLSLSSGAGTAGDIIFAVNVQRHVAPEEQGRAFGLLYWCFAIGQLIGAVLGIVLTTQAVLALVGVSLGAFTIMSVSVVLSIRAPQTEAIALAETTAAA